jgi:RNA polymerase sigma-70 factor, ECF subfamily
VTGKERGKGKGDDAALVAGLRGGDVGAFDAVYSMYRPRLFGFLGRLARDPALAEDLLQETFLRLARSAPELAEDTKLAAWLFTVARNLFFSQRRWALLDVARVAELRLWAQIRGEQPSPFTLAAGSETERRLEAAVAALPLAQREVLLLVAVEGMSPTEAAGVLGLAAEAVRKRLERARATIEAFLAKDERR